MNNSDEVQQFMRITLEGAEYVMKASGTLGAHALSAMAAILSQKEKTAGKVRVSKFVKEGGASWLQVHNDDMATFAREAKKYGILFAGVKHEGEYSDIIVNEKDLLSVDHIAAQYNIRVMSSASSVRVTTERDSSVVPRAVSLRDTIAEDRDIDASDAIESFVNQLLPPEQEEPDAPELGVKEKSKEDQFLDDVAADPRSSQDLNHPEIVNMDRERGVRPMDPLDNYFEDALGEKNDPFGKARTSDRPSVQNSEDTKTAPKHVAPPKAKKSVRADLQETQRLRDTTRTKLPPRRTVDRG